MIAALSKAAVYAKDHPQILFALALVLFFPLLFLYTGQQFLEVGRANQETLQQQRLGLMHDVLATLVSAQNFDAARIQAEFKELAALNPDIRDFKVLRTEGSEIIPIAAMDEQRIGIPEEDTALYRNASIRADESIIFEFFGSGERVWNGYRAVETQDGRLYFIYTQLSLSAIDSLFAQREQAAYFSLVFVYAFVLALAVWHIKVTDYRYLYIAAQKTNETKDLFTNMIAHELRAPLTAIRGYSDMLTERLSDPEQKKYASRVAESAERLIAIVNDLLEVARLQSGKLTITKEEFQINQVIKAVLAELGISAREKEITLVFEDQNEFLVYADEKRLHQALTNLVSNAIKYTQAGKIELSLEDKPAYIELRVKDTGMGIAADDQKKLFAPFFRVADSSVEKITGSGLGMWITKEFIELMDGKIGVESIKGVGTHIVVSLPKRKIG